MDTKDWVSIVVTAVIGFCTVLVAWLQWRVSRKQLRRDLLDNRLAVFDAVLAFQVYPFGLKPYISKSDDDPFVPFYRAKAKARFLFGDEIYSWLEKMLEKATVASYPFDFSGLDEQGKKELRLKQSNAQNWFSKRTLGETQDLFKPYLEFKDITSRGWCPFDWLDICPLCGSDALATSRKAVGRSTVVDCPQERHDERNEA